MKFLSIFLLLFATQTFASKSYRCEITDLVEPNISGELEQMGDKSIKGKFFSVDRNTGIVSGIGALMNNYIDLPVVVDHGSKHHSFKVVTTTVHPKENISNIQVLVIEEFRQGEIKPFIYLHGTWVFYGACAHI